jgi:hypothetical protein
MSNRLFSSLLPRPGTEPQVETGYLPALHFRSVHETLLDLGAAALI